MLRKFIITLLVIGCFLMQCTLFKVLSFASIAPNLLLILTFIFGFMRGKKAGMWIGFFSGLLIDLFFENVIGLNTILYMYIGYINGFFNQMFYDDDVTLPLVLIVGSDLLYTFLYYIFRFLLRNRLDISYYFIHIMIPELVYTVFITVIIYRLILKLNRKLEAYEKRSASKFG